MSVRGFKLFRLRADGTLGPLFIGARLRVPVGRWVRAQDLPAPSWMTVRRRPGWHATTRPAAPHLSERGRVWCAVSLRGARAVPRPKGLGEVWYVARWLRVDRVLERRARHGR